MVVLPLLSGVDQVVELPAHHLGASDDAVDDGFVDHGYSRGRSSRARISCRARRTSTRRSTPSGSSSIGPFLKDLAGVVRGLEKAGDDHGFEVADGGGAGLQADVNLVRVRQHIAERMPPAGLAGVPGQLDQPIPFGASHPIELEQLAQVSADQPGTRT